MNAAARSIGSVKEGTSGDAGVEHEEEAEPKKTNKQTKGISI